MDKCVKDKNFKIRNIEWADEDYIYYEEGWKWADGTPTGLIQSDVFKTYAWEEYKEQNELPDWKSAFDKMEKLYLDSHAKTLEQGKRINKRDFEIGDLVTQNINYKKRIRKLEAALKLTVENLKAVESLLESKE